MTIDDLKMVIALLVLALFVGIYGYLLYLSWRSAPLPPFRAQFVFVANALAATVGTIVATNFGQQLPDAPKGKADVAAKKGAEPVPPAADATVPAGAVKDAVTIQTDKSWRQNVPAIYNVIYCLLGLAAIVTWMVRDPPDMVNTLAYITFGLMLNIVRVAF